MSNTFHGIGIVFLLFQLANLVAAQDCRQEEFSKCAEPLEMLHLTSEFSIGAERREELESLCQELRKGIRCIQSYTRRCMDIRERTQFNRLYHGTSQFIRDLCNRGDFQDEYLKNAPCFALAKNDFETCSKHYKDEMVFLQTSNQQEPPDNTTINENIRTICCSIAELVTCSENAANRICGEDAAIFTRNLVNQYASSLTRLYCEDYTRQPKMCINGQGSTVHNTSGNIISLFLTLAVLTTYRIS